MIRISLAAALLALVTTTAWSMPVNDAPKGPNSTGSTDGFVDAVVQKRQEAREAYAQMTKKRKKALKAAVARANAPASLGIRGWKTTEGPARPTPAAPKAKDQGGHTTLYVLLAGLGGALLLLAVQAARKSRKGDATVERAHKGRQSASAHSANRGEPNRPRMPKIDPD